MTQSWHSERDAHCTLCWRKGGALLLSITFHFPNTDEENERKPGCKIQSGDVHKSRSRPVSSECLRGSIGCLIPLHQPRRVRAARCRSPSTDRLPVRRGAARCFIPLDGSALLFAHLYLRTRSLHKVSLCLEELGFCSPPSPPPLLSVSVFMLAT